MADVVAALDCGSNSTRLLITDRVRGELTRQMRITRLSQGVDATGRLSPEGLRRTFDVLEQYRILMDDFAVERGLLVATSAVRDAANADEFLEGARAITGVDVRVLSGTEEAWYSYEGATSDLAGDLRPTVIVDIGGGSTELAMVLDDQMYSYSMQLGCVRVSERTLGPGVVSERTDAATRSMIAFELNEAFTYQPAFQQVVGQVRLVGLAGTVSTLVSLDLGLATYDHDRVHHHRLTRESVQRWRDLLATETPAQRLTHPGMVSGREDVLVAGLYVLDAVMERFGVEELLSSESDILDGVAASLLR